MGINIRINVTKSDIVKGVENNMMCCPIALACRRAGLKGVRVKRDRVECASNYFYDRRFLLPQKASTFIQNFDNGVEVSVFSFTLTT